MSTKVIKKNSKNKISYTLILLLIICLYTLAFFVNFNGNNQKDENILPNFNNVDGDDIENDNIERTNLSACTGEVVQKECYNEFPKPILTWSRETENEKIDNYIFVVQIDDNKDFSLPEFDTEELQTSNSFFEVDQVGLNFETTYNWRIKVKNSFGIWSGWAEAEESFITSPICK